jgi:ribosomal protein L21E
MTTTDTLRRLPRVGDRVRIERNEATHPTRGTWRQWRGRTGTVVAINSDRRPIATEYGVAFGTGQRTDAWFLRHELAVLA